MDSDFKTLLIAMVVLFAPVVIGVFLSDYYAHAERMAKCEQVKQP